MFCRAGSTTSHSPLQLPPLLALQTRNRSVALSVETQTVSSEPRVRYSELNDSMNIILIYVRRSFMGHFAKSRQVP